MKFLGVVPVGSGAQERYYSPEKTQVEMTIPPEHGDGLFRPNMDRRRENRMPYGSIIHWGPEELEPARSVDLSFGGIGFVASRATHPGTEVEVAFLDRSVAVRGIVRSHHPVDGGLRVGVQFHKEEREVVEVVLAVS
jgi:hypothetical protein